MLPHLEFPGEGRRLDTIPGGAQSSSTQTVSSLRSDMLVHLQVIVQTNYKVHAHSAKSLF